MGGLLVFALGCGASSNATPPKDAPPLASTQSTKPAAIADSLLPACAAPMAPPSGQAWFAVSGSAPPAFPAPSEDTGTVAASAPLFAQPSAAYDEAERLVVVWPSEKAVEARRFSQGKWETLPSIPAPGATAEVPISPALAVDRNHRPLVYFWEKERIRVYRLEGSSFRDISPRKAPPKRTFAEPASSEPIACPAVLHQVAPTAVALDKDGNPAVAWAEPGPGSMRFVVHRYTGSAWVSSQQAGLGPIDYCAPHSRKVHLFMDPKGAPRVFWYEDRAIREYAWNGSRFSEIMTSVPQGSTAWLRNPWIAFDDTDKAWYASVARDVGIVKVEDRVRVSYYDGKTYQAMPDPEGTPLRGEILAFEGGVRPRIALYEELDGVRRIRVLAAENHVWKELSGKPEETAWRGSVGSVWPSVALPLTNAPPVIVYRAASLGTTALLAQEWAPGGYRPLGGQGASASLGEGIAEGERASIAMRDEEIAVAWLNAGAKPTLSARYWNGCAWTELPTIEQASGSPILPRRPFVALDANGEPWIAWMAQALNIAHFHQNRWETVSAPDSDQLKMGAPRFLYGFALDAEGAPVLGVGGGQGAVAGLFAKGNWQFEASYLQPLHAIPALALDAERNPVLATLEWNERAHFRVYVRRHEKGHWVDLPPWESAKTEQSGFPPESVLVAGGPAGRVAMSFRRNQAAPASLAEWDGKAWTTHSDPEAKTASNPSAPGPGGDVSLAYDAAGRLLVAYSDRDSAEILVKRYEAGSWADIAGSSAPPGISATAARSVDPVLAHAQGKTCVLWSDVQAGTGRVLMRCHQD